MRTTFAGLATLIGVTGVVGAQPSLTATQPTEAAPAPPIAYVAGGLMAGGSTAGLDGAFTLEGGYRLAGVFWLHGLVARGHSADDQGGGAFEQARAGVEARGCWFSSILCVVGGADLGYLHATWISRDQITSEEIHDNVIVTPHVGLDIGGRHLRFRPGIEAYVGFAGHDVDRMSPNVGLVGLELTTALAYQW